MNANTTTDAVTAAPASNLVQTIQNLLPIAESLGKTIAAAVQAAKQSGELTADQEAAFQARMSQVWSAGYAQPEG